MIPMSIAQRLDIAATDKSAYAPLIALEEYVHGGASVRGSSR